MNTLIRDSKNKIIIESSHNGYQRIFGGTIHKRRWIFKDNSLILKDRLIGRFNSAISRIYFHPDIELELSMKKVLIISIRNIKMKIDLGNSKFKITNSYWYPEFGLRLKNKCLEINIYKLKQ